MYTITTTFHPHGSRLEGRNVTAQGLNGLFFNVLEQTDPAGGKWLHEHASPKPYSVISFYTEQGELAGLRYAAVTENAAAIIAQSWQKVYQLGAPLKLGRYQQFTVSDITVQPGPDWMTLAESRPIRQVKLRFLSPTSFKQGPGDLPLPLPGNVFRTPFVVWNSFAPAPLAIPQTWLDWCGREVFVTEHQIETATIALSREDSFTGFVGAVTFKAHQGEESSLCIWNALAQLAAFSGVGRKTTMGMGAVERVD
ncbi:MAG: CRISPR system precrRNA processing endoribonuclease RAMP protein Cas6 [Chloroflexi bacterium]|nr:CRISPR system precrRNA processing endoribonuclease RAMP protein Cas6 [Chloroflexota bacterium]